MRSSTRYTVIFFSVLLVVYLLLLDTLAKPLFESQASELYGAEVSVEDGSTLVLLAADREGYANLCRLLTLGRRRSATTDRQHENREDRNERAERTGRS